VGNRRASDRRYKRRSKAKTATGHVAREETILGEIARQNDDDRDETFRETARRLAVKRGSNCDFGNDKWDAKLDKWDAKLTDQKNELIGFYIFCAPRGFDQTYFVPVAEFEAVAREVAKELARKKEEP
ncbi:unnamed protein product, partial [marine sediment metagenome]